MSTKGDSIDDQDCDCDPRRYYLPADVVVHNSSLDCWVSYLGGVYDLTEFCQDWRRSHRTCVQLMPIIKHAGKDISHWFDHLRDDKIKHHVHPLTGETVPYCPHGSFPDVETTTAPSGLPFDKCPWWLDDKYRIGYLSRNPRPCRVVNMLASVSAVITVCEEDTIARIQERFLIFNAHGKSYDWKFEGKPIDMNKTLTENGITDEREKFARCGLPDDIYIPSLLCYFKDDLTEE